MSTEEIVSYTLRYSTPSEFITDTEVFENISMYIKTEVVEDYIEFPLIIAEYVKWCFERHKAVYLPVVEDNYYYMSKSASSLMTYMARIRTQSIVKVMFKDDIYYIGLGLVLRNDFSPILSYTIKAKKGDVKLWQPSFEDDRLFLKVNSNIYDFDDPVSKFVRNHLIPKTATARNVYVGISNSVFERINVIICDTDEVINMFKPKVPTHYNNILGITGFLQRNVTKICDEWQ